MTDRPPLLFRVLHAEKAKSTHHKLALDALTHLRCDRAEAWRDLFLRNVEPYFKGAKAPDKTFKDFRNHVLHVRDGLWGGAPGKVREWYAALVEKLAAGDRSGAAYAAGVLSHYYADPLMPFHTGQSEKEKVIHRAAEWSCTKSYDRFKELLDTSLGWPDVAVPVGEDWLELMTIAGAARGHEFYDELCDRYDFAAGVKNPPAGLDEVCRRELALCCGHAAVGFARILDRAIGESGAAPPPAGTGVIGFLTLFSKPILWLTRKLSDAADRREVLRIWKELQKTGDVAKSLPAEQRAVRAAYESEMGEKGKGLRAEGAGSEAKRAEPAAAPAPSTPHLPPRTPSPAPVAPHLPPETPSPAPAAPAIPRAAGSFRLHPGDPVADAPSIGPKTADRLVKAGVNSGRRPARRGPARSGRPAGDAVDRAGDRPRLAGPGGTDVPRAEHLRPRRANPRRRRRDRPGGPDFARPGGPALPDRPAVGNRGGRPPPPRRYAPGPRRSDRLGDLGRRRQGIAGRSITGRGVAVYEPGAQAPAVRLAPPIIVG